MSVIDQGALDWHAAVEFVMADLHRVMWLLKIHAERGESCLVCAQSGSVTWPCLPYRIAEAARARLLVPEQRRESR